MKKQLESGISSKTIRGIIKTSKIPWKEACFDVDNLLIDFLNFLVIEFSEVLGIDTEFRFNKRRPYKPKLRIKDFK